jgi:hypothetical protein
MPEKMVNNSIEMPMLMPEQQSSPSDKNAVKPAPMKLNVGAGLLGKDFKTSMKAAIEEK